jgi:hypothetical protein
MSLWLALSFSAFSQGAEVDAANARPTKEIDMSAWGFRGLPPLERFTFRSNVTVNFLDDNHPSRVHLDELFMATEASARRDEEGRIGLSTPASPILSLAK